MKSAVFKKFGCVAALAFAALIGTAHAAGPVAKLTQVDGEVEYSKDGERWRPVSRNKYLFEGYQVRTGADGTAVVINQISGKSRDLGNDALILVEEGGARAVAGELSEPQSAFGSFFQALYNKFSKAQRYTTVRRSAVRPEDFSTARQVKLSHQYPDLVWSKVGPEYSYRLTISNDEGFSRTWDVAHDNQGEVIRFTVPELAAGTYDYKVELLLNGEVIAAPSERRMPELVWLSEDKSAAVGAELHKLRQDPNNDEIVLASYLEDSGLLVPAMDVYHTFFDQNPDETDMKPFLMKIYGDLKLEGLRVREAQSSRATTE